MTTLFQGYSTLPGENLLSLFYSANKNVLRCAANPKKFIKFTIITKKVYIIRGNSTEIIEINTDIIHYKAGEETVALG